MHPHRAKAKAMHAAKIKGFATGGRVGSSDISEPKVKLMKGEEGKGYANGGMAMGMKAKGKPHMGGSKKAGTHVNVVVMPHGGGAPAGGPAMPPPMPNVAPPAPAGLPPVRPPMGAPMGMAPGMPPMHKHGGRVAAFKKGGRVKRADGGDVSRERFGEINKVDDARARQDDAYARRDAARGAALEVSGNMRNAVDQITGKKHGGKVHKATGGRVSKPTATAKPYGGPDRVSKADPLCKPDSGKYKAGAGTGEGRIEKEESYGKNAGKAAKSSSTS